MRRNRYGYTNLKASDQHCELVLHLRAHDMEYRYIYIYIYKVCPRRRADPWVFSSLGTGNVSIVSNKVLK